MSISSVRLLFIPQNAAKLTANAVLPTPPFKLTQDRTIGGMTGSFQSFGKTAVFLKKNSCCETCYLTISYVKVFTQANLAIRIHLLFACLSFLLILRRSPYLAGSGINHLPLNRSEQRR